MDLRSLWQLPEIQWVAKKRAEMELAQLDYQRAVGQALRSDASKRDVSWIARGGHHPGSTTNEAFDRAERVDDPVPGFSGASPYEICQRHAVGQLTRDELKDELTRWRYGACGTTDGYDWLAIDEPGSWADVEAALHHGVIEASLYDEVLDSFAETAQSEGPSSSPSRARYAGE